MEDTPKYTNRLVKEKSPYLLQHAHNPVDWYPWGNEAFQAAMDQDKPIFLSIGYATCHWCHTMEAESFEDSEVAQLLNKAFINIKVDREELPEVDGLYMEFAQSMMSGSAGWPLNVILTPDLQPFFAVTYLPPRPTDEMMGLTDLIDRIQDVWNSDDRPRVIEQAEKIVEVFSNSIHSKGEELPDEALVEDAIDLLYKMADPVYGGMKGAPKFPIAYQVNLLMQYSSLKNDSRALFIVERTLDMMQRGGIYDHLGGGFSRYSVDEKWMVPHFEKMLYDNALLAYAYLEAWKLTKRNLYRTICEDIIQYILRDMTGPEGGFYSAQDADSEGEEGLFYTWTTDEVHEILNEEDAKNACAFFDIRESGNFEGRNVLHTIKRAEEFALEQGLKPDQFNAKLNELKKQLWTARKKRIHPLKDDKILCSWNGLMIYTLAEAGAAFQNKSYIDQAARAADFIKRSLWMDGQLLRRWRDGEASFSAGLDEYAFLIRSLLTLFEVDCGNKYLEWAMQMTDLLTQKFKEEGGGFYQTDGTDPHLIIRNCQFSDGAEPSGNAIHCENLLRLYEMTYEPRYLEEAGDILMAVRKYLDTYSPGYSYHILNLMRFYNRLAPTIVVALNKNKDFYKEIYEKIFSSSVLHRTVIWRKEDDEELFRLLPFVKGQSPLNGKTTLYICHDRVCEKPLSDIDEIRAAIDKL